MKEQICPKEKKNQTVAALCVAVSLAASAAAAPLCSAAPASQPPAAPQPSADTGHLSGKVVETMDGGGYTYLAVMKGGEKLWAAIPATNIKVGQEVRLQRGIEMDDFSSRALGRTFKSILFCGGLDASEGKAGAPGAAAAEAAAGKAIPEPVPEYLTGKAAEVLNSGGYTYINLERNGERSWFAVPSIKLRVGDVVEIMPGAVMKRFTSKTLNRAFPEITFSSQAVRK
jgi:hypothetical protein